jgi:hypothetical protein
MFGRGGSSTRSTYSSHILRARFLQSVNDVCVYVAWFMGTSRGSAHALPLAQQEYLRLPLVRAPQSGACIPLARPPARCSEWVGNIAWRMSSNRVRPWHPIRQVILCYGGRQAKWLHMLLHGMLNEHVFQIAKTVHVVLHDFSQPDCFFQAGRGVAWPGRPRPG